VHPTLPYRRIRRNVHSKVMARLAARVVAVADGVDDGDDDGGGAVAGNRLIPTIQTQRSKRTTTITHRMLTVLAVSPMTPTMCPAIKRMLTETNPRTTQRGSIAIRGTRPLRDPSRHHRRMATPAIAGTDHISISSGIRTSSNANRTIVDSSSTRNSTRSSISSTSSTSKARRRRPRLSVRAFLSGQEMQTGESDSSPMD
jgi:hypothetical protein